MSKKSQALSMSTIVVAALALLVLAIVSLLFISRVGGARNDLVECENNGGVCVEVGQFGSCNSAVENPNFPEYMQYSIARELKSYKCLDSDNKVKLQEKCCAFS